MGTWSTCAYDEVRREGNVFSLSFCSRESRGQPCSLVPSHFLGEGVSLSGPKTGVPLLGRTRTGVPPSPSQERTRHGQDTPWAVCILHFHIELLSRCMFYRCSQYAEEMAGVQCSNRNNILLHPAKISWLHLSLYI